MRSLEQDRVIGATRLGHNLRFLLEYRISKPLCRDLGKEETTARTLSFLQLLLCLASTVSVANTRYSVPLLFCARCTAKEFCMRERERLTVLLASTN